MTDEQIIKALECCATDKTDDCFRCPYDKMVYNPGYGWCADRCREDALNLINRKKAEIESLKQIIDEQDKEIIRLQKRIIFWREDLNYQPEKIKSEAIKEFAERLKSKLNDLEFRTKTHRKTVPTKFCDDNVNWVLHECVPRDIDNLVKEMTEVRK